MDQWFGLSSEFYCYIYTQSIVILAFSCQYNIIYLQLKILNWFRWCRRWLHVPHRFLKHQSPSTTVLFRTMFTHTISAQPTYEMTLGFKPFADVIPLIVHWPVKVLWVTNITFLRSILQTHHQERKVTRIQQMFWYFIKFSLSEKKIFVLAVSKDRSEDFVCGFCDFFRERFHVQILDVIKLHVHA